MDKKEPTKFVFQLRDPGDRSVGIMPINETVTILFGSFDLDYERKDYEDFFKKMLASAFEMECWTPDELKEEEEFFAKLNESENE